MREATINKIFHYTLFGLIAVFSMLMLGLSLWNLLAPEELCWMRPSNAVSCVVMGGAFSFIVGMILGKE